LVLAVVACLVLLCEFPLVDPLEVRWTEVLLSWLVLLVLEQLFLQFDLLQQAVRDPLAQLQLVLLELPLGQQLVLVVLPLA